MVNVLEWFDYIVRPDVVSVFNLTTAHLYCSARQKVFHIKHISEVLTFCHNVSKVLKSNNNKKKR